MIGLTVCKEESGRWIMGKNNDQSFMSTVILRAKSRETPT